jgi:tRNA(Arg) A34 adenosine deaminase TadA
VSLVLNKLNEAAKVAKRGQKRDFRLGAIAKRKDGVFVSSCNGRTRLPEHSAHAEYRALQKAGKGSTLWVARVNLDGTWCMAKPCHKCQSLIKSMAVKRVYYTIGPNEYGTWIPGNPIKNYTKSVDEKGRCYWHDHLG